MAPDGSSFFGAVAVSGAHAESVRMVAGGAADLAAIDFVSWGYARRFRSEAAGLRVLALTDPTPGLPLIAAAGTDVARHRRAVRAAIAGLDTSVRETLGIAGFAELSVGDYRVVVERFTAAAPA